MSSRIYIRLKRMKMEWTKKTCKNIIQITLFCDDFFAYVCAPPRVRRVRILPVKCDRNEPKMSMP